jgi:hypothetical protein
MAGNFVFDIDDTVTYAVTSSPKNAERSIRKQFGDEFYEKHCFKILKYPHYIFPGFYALFQWLHAKGGKIFFFSAGVKERNEEFADKVMHAAFGENPPVYRAFSRHHCIDTTSTFSREILQAKFQSYSFGNYKKKLGGIVVPFDEVPNSLLIEDDHSYMTKGEEYNLVYARSCIGYAPEIRRGEEMSEYDSSKLFDNMAGFHKAFYLAGLFTKVFEVQAEKNCTLVEATREVQMEGISLTEPQSCWYRSRSRLKYYLEGQKILSQIDPKLNFLYPLPDGDDEKHFKYCENARKNKHG